jgi:hypothetical protein
MLLKVELNRVISEDEVIHAINGLKNNKACGGDLIINELLKYSASKLLPILVSLFHCCNNVCHSAFLSTESNAFL